MIAMLSRINILRERVILIESGLCAWELQSSDVEFLQDKGPAYFLLTTC